MDECGSLSHEKEYVTLGDKTFFLKRNSEAGKEEIGLVYFQYICAQVASVIKAGQSVILNFFRKFLD